MMFEFLVPYLILACALNYSARYAFSPQSWSIVWASLLGSSALLKIIIEVPPHAAPYAAFALLAGFAILIGSSRKGPRWRTFEMTGFAIMAILLLRGLIPQFDVDSLSYHLPALQWLYQRADLPLAQRTFVGQDVRRFWIGTEDFANIPGLLGNLALYAGVMGSVFKCLTFATIVSVVPRSVFFVVMTGLLLVFDDHFLFSGQNRSVFLNPAFIGLAALSVHFSVRAFRGHSRSGWVAIALLLQVCSIKFHGLYLFLMIGLPTILGLGVRLLKKRAVWPRLREWMLLAGGCVAVFSVYGFNLLNTGTPFYPFDFGPFKTAAGVFAEAVLEHEKGLFALLVERHYRILTYPGNLALKAVAVLILPTLFFGMVSNVKYRWFTVFRLNRRRLQYAIFCFLICVAWEVLMTHLHSREARFDGRYPRLIFGVAIIGISYATLSIGEIGRRFGKFFTLNRPLRLATPLVVFLFCAVLIDRHSANIPLEVRPSWQDILTYLSSPKVSPDDLFQESILLHLSSDVLAGRRFLQHCEKFFSDPKLGSHVLVVAEMNWPSYLGLTHADRIYPSMGASYRVPVTDHQMVTARFAVQDPSKIVCESSGYALLERF